MFIPYMKTPMCDGRGCPDEVNTWKKLGRYPDINQGTIRKGLGLSFQRMFAADPCPVGWTPGSGENWCHQAQPEFIPLFYTDKAFLPKNQYWEGNFQQDCAKRYRNKNFDNHTVSPFTGLRSQGYIPFQESGMTKYSGYGSLGGKHSLVASE